MIVHTLCLAWLKPDAAQLVALPDAAPVQRCKSAHFTWWYPGSRTFVYLLVTGESIRSRSMALSLLATAQELDTITDIASLLAVTGVQLEIWNDVERIFGGVPSLQVLAAMPKEVFMTGIPAVRIGSGDAQRMLTPSETIQVGLTWRVARQKFGLIDIDPFEAPPLPLATASQPVQAASQEPGTKRIKCATVIDQADETEIRTLSADSVAGFFANHVEVTGAEPLPECEPTEDQISALHEKIILRGEAPYADFSVLTPYGKRMQKTLRMRGWMLQQDGSYRAVDIPGPPSYDAWYACFRVYRSVLLMLRHVHPTDHRALWVAKPASLEHYLESFKALAAEFPECWHLCAIAEDRCRGEHFPRLRRALHRAHQDGKLPIGIEYDPFRPWDAVFVAAASDTTYWDREVRRPAVAFLARGSMRGTPGITPDASAALQNVEEAATNSGKGIIRPPGQGTSRQAVQKRKAREQLARADFAGVSVNTPAKTHPKKWGTLHLTTTEGREICYNFAKGSAESCCTTPCPNSRVHVCQFCLGDHRNDECDERKPSANKGQSKRTRKH